MTDDSVEPPSPRQVYRNPKNFTDLISRAVAAPPHPAAGTTFSDPDERRELRIAIARHFREPKSVDVDHKSGIVHYR